MRWLLLVVFVASGCGSLGECVQNDSSQKVTCWTRLDPTPHVLNPPAAGATTGDTLEGDVVGCDADGAGLRVLSRSECEAAGWIGEN